MKLLVTGGTGFLGRALVPRLKVWTEGVDLLSRTAGHVKCDLRRWDGGIPPGGLNALRGRYDGMVHLAARYDLRAGMADAYLDTIAGTQTALTLAAKLDIPAFVHISTVAVALGDDHPPGGAPYPTDRLSVDHPFPDSYAYSKAHAEAMVRGWTSGVACRTICRLGIVVGDTEGNPPLRLDGPYCAVDGLSRLRHLLRAAPGPLPLAGHEQARLPLVPVDIASWALDRLIQRCVRRPEAGVSCFHLTPRQGVSLGEFYRFVLDGLGLVGRRFCFTAAAGATAFAALAAGIPKEELAYALSLPRALLEQEVQATYAQIKAICEHAAGSGAKIIGLGVCTKAVGDAGVSINQTSPIPVTTGNSLSASATLWAVHEVTRKLGLVKTLPGGRRFDGVAMVIGASGSIGSVSAKLLAFAFKRLVLVAPNADRLHEVAREIGEIAPGCDLVVSTSANDWAAHADVIVTATSSRGQKVVDVGRLKPGAIVCDCSRPLDFTIEDAMARPDVLIIESGEVLLPGPATLDCYIGLPDGYIGLPDGAVWACLGETALLALADRYEAFSLGRDLDWRRVKEIYQLARVHGVGLAAIRGHAGVITGREIALTRELALKGTGEQR